MARELPSLNLLRAFEAAGRSLNFRAAAEALNVTPSAISHQVRELEEQLGLPLFVRGAKALTFTPEGARYFTEVSAAMDRLRAATAALTPTSDEPLRVSTAPLADADVLAPALGRFLREHPGLKIRLEGDWKSVDVAAGETDIAIRMMQAPSPDAIPVCPVRVNLVCAPSLAETLRAEAPAALARQVTYRLTDFGEVWPNWCKAQGWPATTAGNVELNTYRGLLNATAQGHGMTLGVFPFVVDWIEDGRLVLPFPQRSMPTGQLCIVVRDAVRRRPEVIDFIGWVRELFRDLDRRSDEFFSPTPA